MVWPGGRGRGLYSASGFAVVLVLVLVGVGVLVGRLLGFGFFGLLGVVGESRVTKR